LYWVFSAFGAVCQVSNWFINARVRLWKPMIEEMYEDLKKASGGGEGVAA